jgi:hypothetical protein
MPRVLIALCLVGSPSLLFAQSVYVGAAAGIDTTVASHFEIDGQPQVEQGGTSPSFAGRAGLAMGDRWGAEVEVSYTTTIERTVDETNRLVTSPVVGGFPPVVVFPSVTVESEQRSASVNALGWFSYPASARLELVVLAGVAFNRIEFEQQRTIELPQPFPSGFPISFGPRSTSVVAYDAGPLVGVEGRIAFGDRFRLVPGLRLSSISAGWSIRPTVGAAWMF